MNESKLDIKEYRNALGSFLTGVTVVTTIDEEDKPVGFTANSFTSVSLDPPLVLTCIAKKSFLSSVFSKAESFAINILGESQQDISNLFASQAKDRFSQIDWNKENTGSPVLDGVKAWLDCKMHQSIDAGDHIILIGNVVAFNSDVSSPLAYFQGEYVQLAPEKKSPAVLKDEYKITLLRELF